MTAAFTKTTVAASERFARVPARIAQLPTVLRYIEHDPVREGSSQSAKGWKSSSLQRAAHWSPGHRQQKPMVGESKGISARTMVNLPACVLALALTLRQDRAATKDYVDVRKRGHVGAMRPAEE